SVETNNSLEEAKSQATNTTESKRKRVSCHMNAKIKTRENEELSLIDDDTTESKRKRVPCCMNAKKKTRENDDDDDNSLENTYDQRSSVSNMTNITSSLTRSYSFESTNNQLSIASNTTNITTSSLIDPFKNNLEVYLYLVDKFNVLPERNASNAFKMPFFRTRVINKQIIDALIRSLFPNIQNTRASDRAALQTWVFGCYRNYNASMRCELRKLSKQPTMQQITEYITESNWIAFLKHHMNVVNEQKTFKDQPENIIKFNNFIRSAFNLFVQENLLDKDVIDAVKDLNYITVDIEIFTADGKDSLQQLDIRSLLKLD
ncbi:13506_t:CDS:2, partial [Funneliformis caledonium]